MLLYLSMLSAGRPRRLNDRDEMVSLARIYELISCLLLTKADRKKRCRGTVERLKLRISGCPI